MDIDAALPVAPPPLNARLGLAVATTAMVLPPPQPRHVSFAKLPTTPAPPPQQQPPPPLQFPAPADFSRFLHAAKMRHAYADARSALTEEQFELCLLKHIDVLDADLCRHSERPMMGVPALQLAFNAWCQTSEIRLALLIYCFNIHSGVCSPLGGGFLLPYARTALQTMPDLREAIERVVGAPVCLERVLWYWLYDSTGAPLMSEQRLASLHLVRSAALAYLPAADASAAAQQQLPPPPPVASTQVAVVTEPPVVTWVPQSAPPPPPPLLFRAHKKSFAKQGKNKRRHGRDDDPSYRPNSGSNHRRRRERDLCTHEPINAAATTDTEEVVAFGSVPLLM